MACSAPLCSGRWGSRLFDDAAGDAAAAAAERGRLVAVIVAAGVDHHRLSLQRGDVLQMRRGQRLRRGAVRSRLQQWKITLMAAAVGAFVLAGLLRIEM